MKILHIPYNIASQLSITVRALRDCGMVVRGWDMQHTAHDAAADLDFEGVVKGHGPA